MTTGGYSTKQERFWAGGFGDAYIERNRDDILLASKTALFAKILSGTDRIESAIEFGCNIGLNLHSLRRLLPHVDLTGIEINTKAADEAEKTGLRLLRRSMLGFRADHRYDFVLSSGALIHIAPEHLSDVYDALDSACGRYLCIVEYYNPEPTEIPYRGHRDRLFKRDFAGEILDRFSDLRLADCGFVYHRADQFALDDVTWFLLERR